MALFLTQNLRIYIFLSTIIPYFIFRRFTKYAWVSKSSLDVCYFVDLPLALKSFTAFLLYTKGNKEGNLRL